MSDFERQKKAEEALWAETASGATVVKMSNPERRYRCLKGHHWENPTWAQPFICIDLYVDGRIVSVAANPCPFCYVEFFKSLPQAEEVKDGGE